MSGYIGKINAGGTTRPIASTLYGTCATAAATAAKVVTCSDFDTLITGVMIAVKFTYSNTASSPTLNVNGTGAKTIYRYGTTAPSTSAATSWNAGSVICFIYDGSYWQMTNWLDTNTTSVTSLSYATGTLPISKGGTGATSTALINYNALGSASALGTTAIATDNSNFTVSLYTALQGVSGSSYRGCCWLYLNAYSSGTFTIGNLGSQTQVAHLVTGSAIAPETMIFGRMTTNQPSYEICIKITTDGKIYVYSNDVTTHSYSLVRGFISWNYK